MRNIFIVLHLFIVACNQEKITDKEISQDKLSDIEVIKVDLNITSQLEENSDSVFYDTTRYYQGAKSTEYIQKDKNEITKVFHDTLGNIMAIMKYENDSLIEGAEYYPNGQIMGKLPERKNGKLDGPVRYYYENGRVRSEGVFKNGLLFGKWKNYSEEGRLISIDDHGEGNLNPIKTTKVE